MKKLFVIVGVVLFFVSGCAVRPETARDVRFSDARPGVVNVMTFNVRANNIMDFGTWSWRKEPVFDLIAGHAPDIFGLQEPLEGQVRQFRQAFGQYDSYSAGGADGKDKGQSCPIFWRKDRFTLLDSGTFWFSERPDKPGTKNWGHIVPRFCSWVRLAEKGRGANLFVYNTHLSSVSQNSREKSVRLLAEKIAARKSDDPFIIIGDFNMKPSNPAMEFLTEKSAANRLPVVDAWLELHPDRPDASTCNFGTWATGPQIDHIELGANVIPLDVRIDNRKVNGRYPSDHFPVIAKIIVPAEPAASAVAKAVGSRQ